MFTIESVELDAIDCDDVLKSTISKIAIITVKKRGAINNITI